MKTVARHHSLSTKLLVSVILWVICAVIFTGYTLTLLWQLENGGVAINDAGSLRMRIYRMVITLEQKNSSDILSQEKRNFEIILNDLTHFEQSHLFFTDSSKINLQINQIEQFWQKEIIPFFLLRHKQQPITADNLILINTFVEKINVLVKLIENQNTQHISWLRFIQTLLIIMVIFSAFTGIYLLYRLVIRPLTQLQEGIKEISLGHLSKRITPTKKDEFGIVLSSFNQMAANLQDLYAHLEDKVSQKTADLEEKNLELSALYDITAFLHESHTQEIMAQRFLENIIDLSHADAGSIRLLDNEHSRLNFICSKGLPDELLTIAKCHSLTDCICGCSIGESTNSSKVIQVTYDNTQTLPLCMALGFEHFIIIHISHNNHKMGIMTLYFKRVESTLPIQTQHLIETLAQQFAVAIENQQLALSDKQLAVMEERNLIAQGLHDSIAQSLSFLNLQAQMLNSALINKEFNQMIKNITFIQQGIQECYDDVRELLLNFRTRINNEDFKDVIQRLLDRFKQQTKVDVQFTDDNNGPSLSAQQQLQVIFILQEALSNIRKHAKCNLVTIHFRYHTQFELCITDNGCGFDQQTLEQKKTHHVGLSIMKERTAKIGGVINIVSIPHQGTSITLTLSKEQRGIL